MGIADATYAEHQLYIGQTKDNNFRYCWFSVKSFLSRLFQNVINPNVFLVVILHCCATAQTFSFQLKSDQSLKSLKIENIYPSNIKVFNTTK